MLDLPDFSRARVLVIGDVLLDRYYTGPTQRISPEAPVPVVRVAECEDRPGGAANVALNLASLQAQACLVGLVGRDDDGRFLAEELQRQGVTVALAQLDDFRTIVKLRVMSRNQQLLRLDFERQATVAESAQLEDLFQARLDQANVVVISDYAKGAVARAQDFIRLARAHDLPVLVDPKGTDFQAYRGATLLTPNLAEFQAVVGSAHTNEELAAKGSALVRQLNLGALLVTRSEAGMSLIRGDGGLSHFPARAREVFDVTGAGDTVIAAVAAAVGAGADLETAVPVANAAAGQVVGKLGTATVTVAQLADAMSSKPYGMQSIVSNQRLLELIDEAHERGETVVMTNGCFDILHAGHVSYLQRAAALGDRLIVAVNDDASVQRLKSDIDGISRPVNDLDDRMAVLAALQSVDWITSFSKDTPQALICKALPDVLVKGGDYQPDEIAGAQCVRDNGGRVEVLDFIAGKSTSDLIRRCQQHVASDD